MENIKQISNTHISRLYAMPRPQGWENLPYELLHSIIIMLGSTRDLLAFTAICPNWRAAFLSVKSTLGAIFPPLIFRNCAEHMSAGDSNVRHTWELVDSAYPSTLLRHASPPSILDKMTLVGCSNSHGIFSSGINHVIVDVFTGTMVSAPPYPLIELDYRTFISPQPSPDSYLFVSSPYCLSAWKVGKASWLHCDYEDAYVDQIVAFKGRVFAKACWKLYTVHLSPGLHLEELEVVWGDTMDPFELSGVLVVCGDMLLLLAGFEGVFFLDLSVEPAKYVRLADECLEKLAFFLGDHGFGQPRHSMNPRRMGLRGGQVYQLNQKAQLYSCPADYCQHEGWSHEPWIETINTDLSRKLTTFTAWV